MKPISRELGGEGVGGGKRWVKVELTPRARDCLFGADSLYSLFSFRVGGLHNDPSGPQLNFVPL